MQLNLFDAIIHVCIPHIGRNKITNFQKPLFLVLFFVEKTAGLFTFVKFTRLYKGAPDSFQNRAILL